MEHLRRARHYGPKTYATWALIALAVAMLAGFSIWD